ncbi:hypothetical protein H3222_16750 [Pseudomonas chengduensis]|jgi:hypothetical protein|nr:hypothetical protein [Pseudomonas chengduensis]MBG0846863.1 hypothetical protein [Pseudomonas chengduensis]
MSQNQQSRPLPLFRLDHTPDGWRLSLSVQLPGKDSEDDTAANIYRRGMVALEDVRAAMRKSLEDIEREQQPGGDT